MCQLRRCLAHSWLWYLLGFALLFVVLLGCWRAEEGRAGTLVLEWQAEPGKPLPRVQVELFADPATERREMSALRRLYFDIRERFTNPEERFISAHHDLKKVQALRLVESRWVERGEKCEIRLKPGKYVLAREIWWGREVSYAHSGFDYCAIEVAPNERAEHAFQDLPFRR